MIIYLITNKVNGKKYVGQHCGDKDARWKQHLSTALKKQDPKPLYRAMRKYGIDNFKYQVLESIPLNSGQALLDEREIHFIKQYDTYIKNGKGYNLTLGGGGNMVTYCTTERSEKLSDSLDRLNYGKYDPETGELLNVYDKLKDAAIDNDILYKSSISSAANSYRVDDEKPKTTAGFIWVSTENDEPLPERVKPLGKKVKRRKINKTYNTELAQYALTGLLVKVWDEPPAHVARSMSMSYPSLLKALRGDRNVVSGYFWRRFPKGRTPDQIDQKLEDHVITLSKRQLTTFPIYKVVNGREVMKYPSVMDAVIDANVAPTQILNALELGIPDKNEIMWKWVSRPTRIKHSVSEGLLSILSSEILSSYR